MDDGGANTETRLSLIEVGVSSAAKSIDEISAKIDTLSTLLNTHVVTLNRIPDIEKRTERTEKDILDVELKIATMEGKTAEQKDWLGRAGILLSILLTIAMAVFGYFINVNDNNIAKLSERVEVKDSTR
jgi:hypothetical protein